MKSARKRTRRSPETQREHQKTHPQVTHTLPAYYRYTPRTLLINRLFLFVSLFERNGRVSIFTIFDKRGAGVSILPFSTPAGREFLLYHFRDKRGASIDFTILDKSGAAEFFQNVKAQIPYYKLPFFCARLAAKVRVLDIPLSGSMGKRTSSGDRLR